MAETVREELRDDANTGSDHRGTRFIASIMHVNGTSECEGCFYVDVEDNPDVDGFWVIDEPDLAVLARIAQLNRFRVRIDADVIPFVGPWLKAEKVYEIALETHGGNWSESFF